MSIHHSLNKTFCKPLNESCLLHGKFQLLLKIEKKLDELQIRIIASPSFKLVISLFVNPLIQCDSVFETHKFLCHTSTVLILYPFWFLDLTPCNFLFPEIKFKLKCPFSLNFFWHDRDLACDIYCLSHLEQDFQWAFQTWQKCWKWCITL